jgi:hypothetical protein
MRAPLDYVASGARSRGYGLRVRFDKGNQYALLESERDPRAALFGIQKSILWLAVHVRSMYGGDFENGSYPIAESI